MVSLAFSEAYFSDDDEKTESTPIDLPKNRSLWHQDQKCSVCLINFNITGLAHTQKSQCLFCYRGVCRRCLIHQFPHPETQKTEKMCKNCRIERYQVKFLRRKIEEAKLERAQMELEVELAHSELNEFTMARKAIQNRILKIKEKRIVTDAETGQSLKFQRELEEKLKIRFECCQVKTFELENNFRELLNDLGKSQSEVKFLKKSLNEKERNEAKLKEKINWRKEKSLLVLQKHTKKEIGLKAEVNICALKDEIYSLELSLMEVGQKTLDLEQSLDGTTARKTLHGSLLLNLNNKMSIFKSIKFEDKFELTEEENESLHREKEKLKKYDQIIEKIYARANLLKKQQNKSATQNFEGSINLYQQSEFLMKTMQENQNAPKCPNYRTCSACNNCIIS